LHGEPFFQAPHDVLFGIALLRCRELVHLGREQKNGAPASEIARQELDVELRETVARIDNEHEPDQGLSSGDVAAEKSLPMLLQPERDRRVTVPREVGEQRSGAQAKK